MLIGGVTPSIMSLETEFILVDDIDICWVFRYKLMLAMIVRFCVV